jgi:hypothetical protein
MAFSPPLSLLSRTFSIVWFFIFVVNDEALADLVKDWLDSLVDLENTRIIPPVLPPHRRHRLPLR